MKTKAKCIVSLALSLILALNCAPMAGAVVSSSDAQEYYQSIITHKDRNENVDSYLIDFDGDGREELLLVWDVWSSAPNGNTIHYEVWQGANCLTLSTTGHPSVCFATGTKRGNSGKLYLIDEYPGWSSTITKIYTVVDGTWKLVEDLYSQHGYETVWKIDGKQCTQSEYESRHALYSVGKQYQPDANASVEMELLNSMEASNGDDTTNAMAEAYLGILDQEVKKYGYMDGYFGFAGGFIRDFDLNGIPELYLLSFYDLDIVKFWLNNAREQIWTWDGKQARLVYDNEMESRNYHDGEPSGIYVVDGVTYYHVSNYLTGGGYYEEDGAVYSLRGMNWNKELSYHFEQYGGLPPELQEEDVYYSEQNGKRTYHSSQEELDRVLAKYKSTNHVKLCRPEAGSVSPGFAPNGRTLRTQLSQLAANQPSSWAKAEVDAAKAAGLVPALTGTPGYQNSITRQQFAELVVTLVEQATGKTLEAAPAGTFSDCDSLAVRKASAAGIVNGMGDGLFAPNQTTNREQIATMVNRAIQYIKAETGTDLTPVKGSISKFADKSSVSSWAVEGVGALAANGIMNGTSSTQLSPKATCTVEQSILLSFRTFEKMP